MHPAVPIPRPPLRRPAAAGVVPLHKGQCPLTPHRARWARGCSGDMRLVCEATATRRRASRLAGLAGGTPCTPHRAHRARGRSETCILAGVLPPLGDGPRGSRVWYVSLPVGKLIPPFGNRPHGSLKKASVDLKSRWPFARQKYPNHKKTSQPARGKPAPRQRGKRKSACSSTPQNLPATPKQPTHKG